MRDALATPSGGSRLDASVEQRLSGSLGHDFSRVRVHADPEADALARSLGARALASGSHVYFRSGQYAPGTSDGLRVLAHEAAHVAQQARGEVAPTTDERGVAENDDAATERAADEAAEAVVGAESIGEMAAAAPAGPASGVVQRWPWDDESGGGGLLDSAASWASGAVDTVSSGAKSAYEAADSAGRAVMSAESAIGSGAASAWTTLDENYSARTSSFTTASQSLNSLVDMGEAAVRKGNDGMVAETEGIPILGSLAKGAAWLGNTTTEATGGIVKGAGDLTAMAGNALIHPVDSAISMGEGMLGIAEHVPLIPGLNTTVKGIHGLVDIARGKEDGQYGATMGELGEHLFNPLTSADDDLTFLAGLGGGKKAWSDKPAEALTRTLTNLAPMALGEGGGVAAEGSEAGRFGTAGEIGEEGAAAGRSRPTKPFDPSQPLDLDEMFPEEAAKRDARNKPSAPTGPAPELPGRGIGGALGDAWDWAGDQVGKIGELFRGEEPPKPQPPKNITHVHPRDPVIKRRNKGV